MSPVYCLADLTSLKVQAYTAMGYRERGRITLHTTVNEFPVMWMTKE